MLFLCVAVLNKISRGIFHYCRIAADTIRLFALAINNRIRVLMFPVVVVVAAACGIIAAEALH